MPGTDALHSALTGTNIHVPYRFTYADAAARAAEAGAVAGDVGCLALQEDDNSLWILAATTPTWVSVADAGGVRKGIIGFTIDGGGSAITTGLKGIVPVPAGCTVKAVRMYADQSGSIVVDIWKDTYANYPPTDADTITAAAVPTITTATRSEDATLTDWTVALSEGDVLAFNVDSADTVTRVVVALFVEYT